MKKYDGSVQLETGVETRDARISFKVSAIRTDGGIFHCLYLYPARDIFTICIYTMYLYLASKMLTETDI